MKLLKQLLVPIPDDKGIHVKSAGAKREKYVYKYVRYFRNSDGKPRNKAKSIGKLSSEPGMMVPNENYFEMYKVSPQQPSISVWNYGYTWLVRKISTDIGLSQCLSEVFGERAADITAAAAFMASEGNVMDYMADWMERSFFPCCGQAFSSSDVSRLFSSITPENRMDFFRRWIGPNLGEKNICYDVTSVSSYSENMPEVERGYNRDHENLSQFNIGMFCNESTRIPLYYNRYIGSLNDPGNLPYVLENARDMGIQHVHMFLDGGFCDGKCLRSLSTACDAFTVGMPAYLEASQNAIDQCRSQIDAYSNELPDCHIYCMGIPAALYGVQGKILVYYDPWNHACLCREMSENIARMEAELKKCRRYPKSRLKYFSRYFLITKHSNDSGFDYEADMQKIEAARKNKGYFLLFTNELDGDPSAQLYYYRAKDADEKLFAQIKVDMEGNRFRTHSEKTTDGKAFVTFVAVIIRSYMLEKLRPYFRDNSTSLGKVISQLSNIIMIETAEGRRFAKAITKKQREILQQFDAYNLISASLD